MIAVLFFILGFKIEHITRRDVLYKMIPALVIPLPANAYSDGFSVGKNMIMNEILDLLPNDHPETDDKYAKWSMYNFVPPPIEKSITYEELINLIRHEDIKSVQIAVQHDCVIATTNNNHRLACLLPDVDFPMFLLDAADTNGALPFEVLKMDRMRVKLREFSQVFAFCIYRNWFFRNCRNFTTSLRKHRATNERGTNKMATLF